MKVHELLKRYTGRADLVELLHYDRDFGDCISYGVFTVQALLEDINAVVYRNMLVRSWLTDSNKYNDDVILIEV